MTNRSSSGYLYLENIQSKIPSTPDDTIVSRTIHSDSAVKIILFGFAPGQELSEHTSSQAATLQFIAGQARLTLGEDELAAGPGTFAYMPPRLPHSIVALTEVTMVLTMFATPKDDAGS